MENIQTQKNEQAVNQENSGKNILQFLTFYLGKEMYGIAVEHVKEVIEYHKVYRVQRVPDYIRGIINLRGEILPVIDLSYLFYGKKSEITTSTGIIFIECRMANEIIVVGIIIDAVESVAGILQENIDSSPAFGEKIRPSYISGVGKANDRFVILLDIAKVLDIDELSHFSAEKVTH